MKHSPIRLPAVAEHQCSACGTARRTPANTLPINWKLAETKRGTALLCADCAPASARAA